MVSCPFHPFLRGRHLWAPWVLRNEHYVVEVEPRGQSYIDEGQELWGHRLPPDLTCQGRDRAELGMQP